MSRQTRPSLCGQRGAAVPDRIGLQPGHPNAFAFRIPDYPGQPPTPPMATTIQPCRPPCDRGGSGGWSANSPTRLLPSDSCWPRPTSGWLATGSSRIGWCRSPTRTPPDRPAQPPFADRIWPQAAAGRRPARLGRRHHLAQATQTSLTRPPAQTAYCSGAATNRWWHPSEQK